MPRRKMQCFGGQWAALACTAGAWHHAFVAGGSYEATGYGVLRPYPIRHFSPLREVLGTQ